MLASSIKTIAALYNDLGKLNLILAGYSAD